MSRLNATIKLVVFLGETFFLLVSIFCTIASSIVYSGKILSLDFSSARQTAFKVLLLSCTVLFCTVIGCCGVANQLVRRGHCHGRRILCLHQFLLITVLVSSISQASTLRKREMSLKLVMVCAIIFCDTFLFLLEFCYFFFIPIHFSHYFFLFQRQTSLTIQLMIVLKID